MMPSRKTAANASPYEMGPVPCVVNIKDGEPLCAKKKYLKLTYMETDLRVCKKCCKGDTS